MAQKGIREFDAKKLLAKHWQRYIGQEFIYPGRVVLVDSQTDFDELLLENPWLRKSMLVVKPDQLFGKRGKHGLVKLNVGFDEAREWITELMGREVTVGNSADRLTDFIIEPFKPHQEEYYLAIKSQRQGEVIYFSNKGGINIEEGWDSVIEIPVGIRDNIYDVEIEARLPHDTPPENTRIISDFIRGLFRFYTDLGFTYLEINPFVITEHKIMPLDLVAKLDDTAHFECMDKWGDLSFPVPFGSRFSKEEEYIKELDEKTGASLKLTILNPKGRVWTMVAGGGASVIYADTIVDLGFKDELANYGEYSGDPSKDLTYEYAKTILDLMTREKDDSGREKFLLIGGGIANFTDVAKTFAGITQALRDYRERLIENKVRIFVRRGGPNYKEGIRIMKTLGQELGIPIEAFGPETHMTRIVPMALGGNNETRL
jgi:ATP-citrate lyase beta-subunit